MQKDSRIFVAGHRGLVGSAITRALSAEGYSNLLLRTRAELDLTRQAAVEAFFEKERPEYVFLAAAKVGGILANDTWPADFIRDNLAVELNVTDAAYRYGAEKLLFLGSSCIYPRMAPQPMTEDCLLTGPLEPTNEWYAVAKIAGIKMCQAYQRQYGFRAVSCMPTNLYGPGDNFDLMASHVLPAMIRKFHLARLAREGDWEAVAHDEAVSGPIPEDLARALCAISAAAGHEPPGGAAAAGDAEPAMVLWGTGAVMREFLHVDDLARACLFLMENYESPEIVNVGTGVDCTIRELAETAMRVTGYAGAVAWDATKPDGTPRKLLDVSRLEGLGWRPRISLEDGMRETYAWYLAHTQNPTA